jgi:ferredoxin
MPSHTITLSDGQSYRCPDSESLLRGMEALGKKGIPVGCRNGGCGVCMVHVLEGTYVARVMSREHVSEQDEAAGRVLACRVRPASDMQLCVIGKMKKSVCRAVEPSDVPPHST